MATLKAVRREMIARTNQLLGRAESVASLTTTTCVVSALAVGTFDAQRFADWWLLRADAASTADRVRRVSNYASATGTLTHEGTNYADTTATGETVELWRPEFEPRDVDLAVQVTLDRLRREDCMVLPAVNGQERYWLDDLSWVQSPSDITRITYAACPVLSRNRYFEQWNAYDTDGALLPDWWTLSGAAATMARSTTGARKGAYSVAVTRAGTNAVLTQSVGLLESGASDNGSLRGQQVTVVLVGTASAASQLRVTVDDGVDTSSTSYHTGDGTSEELTVAHTVSATATKLDIEIEVSGSDGTAYIDECYLVFGQITDTVRRDRYDEYELRRTDVRFDQGAGTLSVWLPLRGFGGQYRLYTQRAYPQFDATRLAAGSADNDTTDAPLGVLASGAIYRLFEGLAQTDEPDRMRYLQIANEWRLRYEDLAVAHLYVPEDHDGGVPLPVGMLGGAPSRGSF